MMNDAVQVIFRGTVDEPARVRRGVARVRIEVTTDDPEQPVSQLVVATDELAAVVAEWQRGESVFIMGTLARDDDLPPSDERAWWVEAVHVGREQVPAE